MNTYNDFLGRKVKTAERSGFECSAVSSKLYPFQAAIVRWAVRRGKAALFEDCGLGKTFQQLEWARIVAEHTAAPVLILTPLAVGRQTVREAEKLGVEARIVTEQSRIAGGINITNYEKIHHFRPDGLSGLVLDESSILKAFDGKTRKLLTEFSANIPYRLACTATPAPNDHMELGNHAEFLGVMKAVEMLSMFFVHDGGDTAKWRLKRHAEDSFWKWVASWAVAIRKPSDIGFSDEGFILPELRLHQVTVPNEKPIGDSLFVQEASTLSERREARKESLNKRVSAAAEIANRDDSPMLVWCDLNAESEALSDSITGAVEVTGSDSETHKESSMIGFSDQKHRVLVSKPTICGYGMNWQHCAKMAFVGLSDSYEQMYQAIRRCWRFGQTRPVDVYVITSEAEGAVVRNIQRKEEQAGAMFDGMVEHMKESMKENISAEARGKSDYERSSRAGENWTLHLGDCIDVIKEFDPNSVHYSIFSPPFASLYTYSASDRDMGNCAGRDEFAEHFDFLVQELYRVLMPGRLLSFHCMNLPSTKERDGVIGIHDFRGELIRQFVRHGFIYHSEVCIWKDPVTAMQRTKAIGLLYKQLRKDSAMSRQGIPDYLVTMRKPGPNPEPVTKTHESFPVSLWQNYASPVWMDINPSDTLQRESAREDDDERHICPLQLQVIERAIQLWTNPGDVVLSPFAGIGSEGYEALKAGRRFVGVELKRSYWEQAWRNLEFAERSADSQGDLFVTQ